MENNELDGRPGGLSSLRDEAVSSASSPKASIPDASPREECDEGAAAWVAQRLTGKQLEALKVLASPDASMGGFPSENGLSPATLWSLNDFRRGERGVLPPLGLVNWDFCWSGRRCWGITNFGKKALASAIEARRAATPQSDAVHESAGPQDDARKDPS